ncbi:4-hydroxy-tetrahydrodipicolinate synthase [Monaibacterium marinum]|uniref:4-hydroxy-tetrahydrodipicolinate synthase n=1 Tax=Pontivivens marinum TaxID=1690039 RepID=A0A2C9CUH7_9RHOB|nr:dihydrodipicolinate synthase family protein [Monaibacterium marinum]SOH94888.1 4-hydroxy-tetrahydrodipicolinate synthase [Monaibacterium marinum]
MKQFRGSHSVNITPFTADGSAIDLAANRKFIDWQIDQGVPGIIILGTTGEFLAVSDAERQAFVEDTVAHVNGRIDVMVGASNAYSPTAARYAREAQDAGAQGLMIIPPYYYTPTEDEIVGYYDTITAACDLPIMLYNNPCTSNVDMSAKLVGRLTREFDTVRYIKEASMDVARVYDIVEETEGVMNVFAGERIVESFLLGAVGYVNPFGNYIPRASTRIWDLLEAGRIEDAKRIQRHITVIEHVIAEGHPTYGHQCYSKALAAEQGYPVGDVRQPLTTFASLGAEGQERAAKLKKVLADLDRLMDELESAAA